MIINLAVVLGFFLLQGTRGNEVEDKEDARFRENPMDITLSGKEPFLGYRFTIFPHQAKHGTEFEGKERSMFEEETLTGKETFEGLPYTISPRMLKGKHGTKFEGKEGSVFEEEILTGKETFEELPYTIAPRMLKGKHQNEFEGKERTKIQEETLAGEEQFAGTFTIFPRIHKGELPNGGVNYVKDITIEESILPVTSAEEIQLFDQEFTKTPKSLLESMFISAYKQNLRANMKLCVKFFFSVQELPHYFAGVTDAILNATKNAVPLAQKLMECTKAETIVESLSCIRDMEPEVRDFYIAEAPLLKQPVLAFREHFSNVKNDLEDCLEIKHNY